MFNREAFYSPLVHAPAFYFAGVVLAFLAGRAALLVVLVVLCLYAVASPALIAFRPRWWLNALLSTVLGIVLLGVLTGTAEGVTHGHFGDDAMVLLFPITIFPVTLLVSLGLRIVAKRDAKALPSAQETP